MKVLIGRAVYDGCGWWTTVYIPCPFGVRVAPLRETARNSRQETIEKRAEERCRNVTVAGADRMGICEELGSRAVVSRLRHVQEPSCGRND